MSTPNQSTPGSDQASKGLIMVVEDVDDLREAMHEFLEQQHYEVISVENGEQALATLQACSYLPDLMLASVHITCPHMGGIELLHEVRKEPSWVHIPFMHMIGIIEFPRNGVNYLEKLGIVYYLQRPFHAAELLSAVEEALARPQGSGDVR